MTESAAPIVNALNRPFWEAADRNQLRLPWCTDTAQHFWPPSTISPWTGGPVEWRTSAPSGRIESLVVYRRPFQAAFARLLPYGIALVRLDCGPRLLVHVENPDDPAAPRACSRVTIRFARIIDGPHALPTAVLTS